jgi:hypothetical protein
VERYALKKAVMTLKALERIKDWKAIGKAERDRAVESLHAGRQVAVDFGFMHEAAAHDAAIRLLEALGETDDATNGAA